jgi:hypothetical protein
MDAAERARSAAVSAGAALRRVNFALVAGVVALGAVALIIRRSH